MDIFEGAVSNLDTKYLIHFVGTPLKKALVEIVQKRPIDPIEYLSQWLYKYEDSLIDQRRNKESLKLMMIAEVGRLQRQACIEEEQRVVAQKRREIFEVRLEEKRTQQEEERKRLELELFLTSPEKKDINGHTALHRRAAELDADFTHLDKMPFLLAERDVEFQTPRDLAQQMGYGTNVTAIDNFVLSLFENGKIPKLQYLLLNGYEHFQQALDLKSESLILPEVSDMFIATISNIQEDITRLFLSIQMGDTEQISKMLVDRPELAVCKNSRSHSPLHVAILCDNFPAVKLILQTDQEAVNITDNLNRSPLHYSYALSEEISGLLLHHKASESAEDYMNNTPIDYKAIPNEINKLKEYYKIETLDPIEPVQNPSEETIDEEARNEDSYDTENPEGN